MTAIPGKNPAETHALLLPDVLYELLTYLDFHSLLHCQHVCQTWRNVISRSRSARQTLFLEPDSSLFDTFLAAEEHDITSQSPAAWLHPTQRIPSRPEFRALFNPWIYTHPCEPIAVTADLDDDDNDYISTYVHRFRRALPDWRFTDRIAGGRLNFCFTPAELAFFTKDDVESCAAMFLTQPPVRRVLVVVQGGYMVEETFDVERDEGVRIGDVMSCVRRTKAVDVMSKKANTIDFTTVEFKFEERLKGVPGVALKRLVTDRFGNAELLEGV